MPIRPMADPDRDLVERARAGDASAFEELVRRHGPRVRRLARHLVRGHADADDVAQETFVRAHQALPRFDGRSEFFTWLYRIAVNLSLNRMRSLAVRKGLPIDDPATEALVEGALGARTASEDPGRILEDRRLATAILEAIETLPESLRTTVVLVCIDQVAQDRAAAILGCSPGTIAWRVHEARKRLRASLAERGLDDALERFGDRAAAPRRRPAGGSA
jgi:RNA polymerase sigma-70 factor (ECF subfamily)